MEVIKEDGVEVVLNQLEPYKIEKEPAELHIEELFSIDTETDEMAELGIFDIDGFDIDSEGNIYVFQRPRPKGYLVYKFNSGGVFLTSFGVGGQGPGEVPDPIFAYVNENDEIQIQSYSQFKYFVFSGEGNLIRQIQFSFKSRLFHIFPLANQNYLKYTNNFDVSTKHRFDSLELFDANFQKLMELDKCDYGPVFIANQSKKEGTPRVFIFQVRNKKIFVGHEKRGYEILVFDLGGNLLRKIRKQYEPVAPPEEFIDNLLVNMGRFKDRTIIPDKMPPFWLFFLDDMGRLFVRTYEEAENQNEYMHDVFSPDGIFITRVSLPGLIEWMYASTSLFIPKAKNQRYYCIRIKESGYNELVVYKMNWE